MGGGFCWICLGRLELSVFFSPFFWDVFVVCHCFLVSLGFDAFCLGGNSQIKPLGFVDGGWYQIGFVADKDCDKVEPFEFSQVVL